MGGKHRQQASWERGEGLVVEGETAIGKTFPSVAFRNPKIISCRLHLRLPTTVKPEP